MHLTSETGTEIKLGDDDDDDDDDRIVATAAQVSCERGGGKAN